MAGIAGMLNTFDLTETVDNIGQVRVFEQVTKYLAEHRASLEQQTKLFIKEKTAEDTFHATIDLAQDAPLVYRHDPINTKLGVGLHLVKKVDSEPFVGAFYRHRYGLAAIACLGVVITQIKASGDYDIPSFT